jgi:hypothetical protein
VIQHVYSFQIPSPLTGYFSLLSLQTHKEKIQIFNSTVRSHNGEVIGESWLIEACIGTAWPGKGGGYAWGRPVVVSIRILGLPARSSIVCRASIPKNGDWWDHLHTVHLTDALATTLHLFRRGAIPAFRMSGLFCQSGHRAAQHLKFAPCPPSSFTLFLPCSANAAHTPTTNISKN